MLSNIFLLWIHVQIKLAANCSSKQVEDVLPFTFAHVNVILQFILFIPQT